MQPAAPFSGGAAPEVEYVDFEASMLIGSMLGAAPPESIAPARAPLWISPKDLFISLLRSNLVARQHRSRKSLEKHEYLFFKSSSEFVEMALGLVSRALGAPFKSLQDYIDHADEKTFSRLLEAAANVEPLAYAVYYLEEIRYRRFLARKIQEDMEREGEVANELGDATAASAAMNYSYRFAGSFLGSEQYGIPTGAEVSDVQKTLLAQLERDLSTTREVAGKMKIHIDRLKQELESHKERITRATALLSNHGHR